MATQPSDTLVIRDYPVALWLGGGLFLAVGIVLVIQPGGIFPGVLMLLGGVLMAGLPTILTVTADRQRGLLTVRHRSIFQASVKEYPLKDIASVDVDGSVSVERGRRRSSYRLVLNLTSGDQVPLRSYYSGGYKSKAAQAGRLTEYLGLPDAASQPVFPLAAQAGGAAVQGDGTVQEGTTDGVAWQAGVSRVGGMIVRRWQSTDFRLPGRFVCLMQKPKGSASFGGGRVGRLLYQQIFNMYGFGPDDLPGMSAAEPVQGLASGVADQFASLTSDQASAQQVLNPWAVTPLMQWAERYPLKTVQSAGTANQLVVLFSPQGVYLTCMKSVAADQAEVLNQLGVDLVRAQGASSPAA